MSLALGEPVSAITPEQGDHLLDVGFSDYLEGLEWLGEENRLAGLEARFPGLNRAFEGLIELLPDPNGYSNTEFPVAACVIRNSVDGPIEVVSTALNSTNRLNKSTEHAETVVLDEAMEKIGSKHLPGHVLVTTVQTCVECTGAAVNTEVDGVIYGALQDDLRGRHARVNGQYKRWRTTPEYLDMDRYLTDSGLFVVGGFKRNEVLRKMTRVHGSWASYYRDPDPSTF